LRQTFAKLEPWPKADAPTVAMALIETLSRIQPTGVFASDTSKGAASVRFPLHAVEILFPSLFPEA